MHSTSHRTGIRVLLLVLCVAWAGGSIRAQQVHIPYRVKNQWGISDQQGKIIIKPVYDEILWGSEERFRMPNGYYKVKKNGKIGLVHAKEILPPVYNDIYIQQGMLIKAYTGDKGKVYFTLEGKRMLTDHLQAEDVQVISLLQPDKQSKFPYVVALFHVKTPEGEKGCYYYNQKQPEESRMLHQGYDRINYRIYKEPVGFTVYLSNRSGFKQEVHYLLNPSTLKLQEVYEKPEEKTERSTEIEVREYSITDSDHYLTVPVPEPEHRYNPSSKNRWIRFSLNGDSLFAHASTSPYGNRDANTTKMFVPLPAGSNHIKLMDHYGEHLPTYTRNDTTYHYRNTVVFNLPEKQALLSSLHDQPFVYDSIQMIRSRSLNRFEFIFGTKDAKGKLMFGIRDFNDSTILPAQYHHLGAADPGLHFFARNGKPIYVVQQQNRWGIIEHDGAWLVPCNYDAIYPLFGKETGVPFHVLVKNNRYGAYVHSTEISAPSVKREPFTQHPPKKLVFISFDKKQNIVLLQHETPDGKMIGLSGENGKMYWKD